MENKYTTKKAQSYFEKFAQSNIKVLENLSVVISDELAITKKATADDIATWNFDIDEGTAYPIFPPSYKNSKYILEIHPERFQQIDRAVKLLGKVGADFDFYDTTTPPWGDKFYIGITSKENFEFFYKELKQFIKTREKAKQTKFDEKTGVVSFKGKKFKLTKDKIRFYFCKKMFTYPINHEVSWDEIYEEAQEHEPIKGARRSIYDAMLGVNKKAKRCFGREDLFKEEAGMYERTF